MIAPLVLPDHDDDPKRAAQICELRTLFRRMPRKKQCVLLHLSRLYSMRAEFPCPAVDMEIASFERACRDYAAGVGPLPNVPSQH